MARARGKGSYSSGVEIITPVSFGRKSRHRFELKGDRLFWVSGISSFKMKKITNEESPSIGGAKISNSPAIFVRRVRLDLINRPSLRSCLSETRLDVQGRQAPLQPGLV